MCSRLFWAASEISGVWAFNKAEESFSTEKSEVLVLFGFFLETVFWVYFLSVLFSQGNLMNSYIYS